MFRQEAKQGLLSCCTLW